MKIKGLLLIAFIVLVGCKNDKATNTTEESKPEITADDKEPTEKQKDGLTLLKGDFLFMDGAAVLQTHNEIYGVVVDDKMRELDEMVQKYKSEATDMVPVTIRGKVSNEKDDKILWENKVEIKEILQVSAPDPKKKDVIKITE